MEHDTSSAWWAFALSDASDSPRSHLTDDGRVDVGVTRAPMISGSGRARLPPVAARR
jgi:hypothetical protein